LLEHETGPPAAPRPLLATKTLAGDQDIASSSLPAERFLQKDANCRGECNRWLAAAS
jgi:hypothetical protein